MPVFILPCVAEVKLQNPSVVSVVNDYSDSGQRSSLAVNISEIITINICSELQSATPCV